MIFNIPDTFNTTYSWNTTYGPSHQGLELSMRNIYDTMKNIVNEFYITFLMGQ